MGRILAIDYGQKRTGIAVTDPLQIIANGLTTVPSSEVMTFLASYMARENVEAIVVGYPMQMNNQPSQAVKFINPFIRKLRQVYAEKEIILADERFTSKMASRALIEGGAKKKQRQDKGLVDRISAVIILQSYLESRAMKG